MNKMEKDDKYLRIFLTMFYFMYCVGWFILAFKVDIITYFGLLLVVGSGIMIPLVFIIIKGKYRTKKEHN